MPLKRSNTSESEGVDSSDAKKSKMPSETEKFLTLLESETDFALDLLRQQDITKPLVFSPLSIALALSLAHAAAKGETRNEIKNALVKGATDEELEKYFAEVSAALLGAENGTKVNIASQIFTREEFPIRKSFLNNVKKLYNAGVTPLDFSDKDESAEFVNEYVWKNTMGKIQDFVGPSSFSDDTSAIIVNAIYFKARWLHIFECYLSTGDYFVSENETRTVSYMRDAYVNRYYVENDEFQVLSLPYQDETYAMHIFLPKQRFGLEDAIKNLDGSKIQKLLSGLQITYMHLKIPKFKIESSFNLNSALKSLGIKKAFERFAADFGNIGHFVQEMCIDDVSHSAIIEVDQRGTVAAAVTKITLCGGGGLPSEPEVKFMADHPFLYMLTKDNHPLFVGLHY